MSIWVRLVFKGDVDAGKENRMAHGDEVRGPLRSHYPCNLGDRQHIAFRDLAMLNLFKGFRLKKDRSLRCRRPLGLSLGADIDHPRTARLVEMRELSHFPR